MAVALSFTFKQSWDYKIKDFELQGELKHSVTFNVTYLRHNSNGFISKILKSLKTFMTKIAISKMRAL